MGTGKEKIPPGKGGESAGSSANAPYQKAAPRGGASLENRISSARAALHDAIRRAGERPLSHCPEVLRLSRELDALIDEIQGKIRDK